MLRPYQEHDLDQIRDAYANDFRRVLLVQPTGAGKGFLCAYIIQRAVELNPAVKIQFWVNRRTLVHDMCQRIDRLGVDYGVIMADHKRKRPHAPVQVVSIDSLRNRSHLPPADLIFCDEGHFCVSDGWKSMIVRYPDAKFLFMTATPIRLDSRGLGEIADVMIAGPSVQFLIDQGYLVPSVVFGYNAPDLSDVEKVAGDYNQKKLAAKCNTRTLVGDAVKTWLKHGPEKSVAFCCDKKHAFDTAEAYRLAGVPAIDVNDQTPDEERDRIWNDYDNGSLMMVTSVGVISYGWDHPICSRVQLLRPTASLQLHLQMIGRGCRPRAGKTRLLVLDHAGNHKHGFYETPREWSLDGLVHKPTDKVIPVATCKQCFFTFASGPERCPSCGALIPKQHRNIQTVAGEIEELERKKETADAYRSRMTDEQKMRDFLAFRKTAREKGYKPAWAYFRYKTRFREDPKSEWYGLQV